MIDFSISQDKINKSNTPYVMATNSLTGFKNAMSMSQQRLAFDYLNLILDKLIEEVDALKTAAEATPEQPKAKAAKATTES